MKKLYAQMKLLIYPILVFSFLLSFTSKTYAAPVSGVGCNLGSRVYTTKIGTTSFYGTTFDVYNTNGSSYAINWNNQSLCDQINTNQISNIGSTGCWVNTYVNPNNNSTGRQQGVLVNYSLQTCNVNLPIDDYTWVILIMVGGLGAYFISRKGLA